MKTGCEGRAARAWQQYPADGRSDDRLWKAGVTSTSVPVLTPFSPTGRTNTKRGHVPGRDRRRGPWPAESAGDGRSSREQEEDGTYKAGSQTGIECPNGSERRNKQLRAINRAPAFIQSLFDRQLLDIDLAKKNAKERCTVLDLDQLEDETPDAWLARLRVIDRRTLTLPDRRALSGAIMRAFQERREDLERQVLAALHALPWPAC